MDNPGMTESVPPRPAYAHVTRSHKGVDAQARRQERRVKLLAAGLETLGTKGYHATTVRDICGQASLSERYFYESFSGLPQLFNTVYVGLHEELLGRLMGILVSSRSQQLPALESAQAALRAWFTFLKEDPRRARIMLIDALAVHGGGSGNSALAAARDYVGTIQAFLELLYPGLSAQGLSPRVMAAVLLGACMHAAKDWVWSNFETPMDTMVSHLSMVFQALDSQYRWAAMVRAGGN
jgi:AcrR family transcriptional regulator